MIRLNLPKSPVILILRRYAEQVFSPLRKTKETTIGRGRSNIKLDNKQVAHPTDHALHDLNGVKAHGVKRQKEFIRQIHMNKRQGHRVAAHHPAPVRNVVLVNGRSVSEVGRQKPKNRHWRKAITAWASRCIAPSQGQNGYGTYQTSDCIDLTHANMPFGIVFPKLWRKQKGANDNRKSRRENMQKQKLIINNWIAFGKERSERHVSEQRIIKNEVQRQIQNTQGDKKIHPRRGVKITNPDIKNLIDAV